MRFIIEFFVQKSPTFIYTMLYLENVCTNL